MMSEKPRDEALRHDYEEVCSRQTSKQLFVDEPSVPHVGWFAASLARVSADVNVDDAVVRPWVFGLTAALTRVLSKL